MQIKIEKFLALTAMLASTQITACAADDGGDDKQDGKDSGLSQQDAASPTHTTPGPTSETPVEAGGPTTTPGPTSEEVDASTAEPTTAADAGADASAGDSGSTSGGDAATEGSVGSGDASTDAAAPDASSETSPEAGPISCGADAADEAFYDNCLVFDACYGADGGTGGQYASQLCYTAGSNYRADVAQAFWDCYASAGIEDPCTEEADIAASSCVDAAMEGACVEENPNCGALGTYCSEISEADCNTAIAPYNSDYQSAIVACATPYFTDLGPNFEGCSTTIYDCIMAPSAE
ncbi:MAG TPA: hypothetical protein VHM70_22260 [Polyangiaceae bacterium]|jgi:hypothetical protein|nr:hypothetical protein [Polyangiaceae bacterium]